MHYVRVEGWSEAIAALAERMKTELAAGKHVLWLLSGGSNLAASRQIMEQLPAALTEHLIITLGDERYGPAGHPDSNWTQLFSQRFDTKRAQLLPVLESNLDFEATREYYQNQYQRALAESEVSIAQFGIGEDGHIAGILPNSVATHPSSNLIIGYHSSPYDRLTLSFDAIKQLTAVYAFAFGVTKQPALEKLISQDLALDTQPAQILKQLNDAYVYNDQVGERP